MTPTDDFVSADAYLTSGRALFTGTADLHAFVLGQFLTLLDGGAIGTRGPALLIRVRAFNAAVLASRARRNRPPLSLIVTRAQP